MSEQVDTANYTRVPNFILDAMPLLTNTELRVVLAVARKTVGWNKESDMLSISQLEILTRLSRQGVIDGITGALEKGLITRVPQGLSFAYTLVNSVDQSNQLTSQIDEPVNSVDQSSQLSRPKVVNSVDTQNKRNTLIKERDMSDATLRSSVPPRARKQKAPNTAQPQDETPEISLTAAGTPTPSVPPVSPSPRRAPKLGPIATALAEVCRIDTVLASREQMIALHKAAKRFSEAGRTVDEIAAFGRWWSANDWRGKQGEPPRLAQVGDTWGTFDASQRSAPVPAVKRGVPDDETPEQRDARMQRIRASFGDGRVHPSMFYSNGTNTRSH